jgi:hypothetical protein
MSRPLAARLDRLVALRKPQDRPGIRRAVIVVEDDDQTGGLKITITVPSIQEAT